MRKSDRHTDRKLHTELRCPEQRCRQSALCMLETTCVPWLWPLPLSSNHITPTPPGQVSQEKLHKETTFEPNLEG